MIIFLAHRFRRQEFFFRILVLYFVLFSPVCLCFEPISVVAGLGAAALAVGYFSYNYCVNNECCDDNWVKFDYTGLQKNLKSSFFGQHIAAEVIPKMLNGFLNNKNPKKALVMSFHGTTGNGKNYLTQIIADSIYKNGTQSQFIHLYVGNQHFPDEKKVALYQELLRSDIVKYTKLCARSLFIFDEVHHMPAGVLDAIRPFVDYLDNIDKVDFRKNIFIFLSNAAGKAIEEVALKAWIDGREREDIGMKEIEPLLNKGSFNEKGGFQFSQIVLSELIDVYVPFFPLERKHVEQCVLTELKAQKKSYTNQKIKDIANALIYYPDEVEIFSASGCKRINQKISLFD